MRISSAGAGRGALGQVLDRVLPAAREGLGGSAPDLGVVFATNHFEDELPAAVERIRRDIGARTLLGCTAEGVIGPEHEHEGEPAVAVWLAALPGVTATPFHLTLDDVQAGDPWPERFGIDPAARPSLLVLGDPFSMDVDALLGGVNRHLPGCPVFGGMASGADAPGQSVLIANDQVFREGAVGVSLAGALAVVPVVSQGCRPIGRPLVITRAERNIIYQLGGRPALVVLNEVFAELPASDQRLLEQKGIFLGRVIDEHQAEFHRGDFLIRNVIGADEDSGALAVADLVRAGTTVQFHVRDAATADEDLHSLLAPHAARPPAGVLMFSCNGRGSRLYRDRDHDLRVVREVLGGPPVAGFFCAGELGPIGGKNFIHGHTASLALFYPV